MAAAPRNEVRKGVADVYRQLQREIDSRRPVCDRSGRCCRFDEFGHRLYVTTIELAAFAASLPASLNGSGQGDCPFQVDGLCSVHGIRPFGCRVFFCDPTVVQWQQEHYERFHARLKQLHQTLEVPYFYVEWRVALREMGWSVQQAEKQPTRGLSLPQLRL